MADKRYLVWTGIHSLKGCCNLSFAPMDSPKGIQERLRILGFDCGPSDDPANDQVRAARIKFRAIADKNLIIENLNDQDSQEKARQKYPQTTEGRENLIELDLKALAKLNVHAKKGMDLVLPNGETFNENLQQALDRLAFAAKGQPQPTDPNRAVRQERRIEIARRDQEAEAVGGVLNTTKHIAVRVDGVPKTFIPFSELACITTKIKNLSSVESLMLRIYRNYDRTEETYHPPPTKLIYQEILNRADIEALPKEIPDKKDKVKRHDENVGALLKLNTNWRNEAYNHRMHAPYKVKVWISNASNAFDEFVPDNPKPVEGDEGTDFLYRLSDAVKFEEVEPPRDPVREGLEVVHDELPLEINPDSDAPPMSKDWPDLRVPVDENKRLAGKKKYWTDPSDQGNGKYMINTPCDRHSRQFLDDNQIQIEQFVSDEYEADVLATYRSLYQSRVNDGADFQFPGLAEVFANIGRHLNIIEMRYCCGEFSDAPDAEKADAGEFLAAARAAVAETQGLNFPYRTSLLLAARFIRAVNTIIALRRNIPEIELYHRLGVIPTDKVSNPFHSRRSLARGFHHCIQTDADTFSGQNSRIEDIFRDIQAVQRSPYLDRSLMSDDARVILFPSYNPLTTAFFTHIRQAPLFILGLIDETHLVADGIFQNPFGFFRHDNFHVVGNSDQNEQQWQTLRRRLEGLNEMQARDLYDHWNTNAETLKSGVSAHNPGLQKVMNNLLFSVLHEPLNKTEIRDEFFKYNEDYDGFDNLDTKIDKSKHYGLKIKEPTIQDLISPAVLESDSIRARLESKGFMDNQIEKMKNMYFGRIFPDAQLDQMDAAKQAILRIIDEFQ